MTSLLIWVARLAALGGIALCAVALVARLQHLWTLAGYGIGSMLQAGMAAMLLACLAYLAYLAEPRARPER